MCSISAVRSGLSLVLMSIANFHVRKRLEAGSDPQDIDNNNMAPIDIALDAWKRDLSFGLPSKGQVATVLSLLEGMSKVELKTQVQLLYTDINTEIVTPICWFYKRFDYIEDLDGWTPLAEARQLKMTYKVNALLDGGKYEGPVVVGLAPSRLQQDSRVQDGLSFCMISEDGLEFSILEQDPDPERSKEADNEGKDKSGSSLCLH